jgi:Asp-tRNA(Asn)/Glu-tRNA(Gln) amidotransferase A subunit family amidase
MRDALDYQLNWNDRFDSGEPVRSYRFNYQEMHAHPSSRHWRISKTRATAGPLGNLELCARQISVVELAEAHIAQIERLNPQTECLRRFRCGACARARRGGWMREGAARPLHGLPVTMKSSIATAGIKCEIGSLLHKGDVPREDAVVVARLRAAGALILGTTNCPEFLMAYETANLLHGRTRNPWDLERTPGGSSGGESAAIAAGLSAAGLGSDSGGSVRVPAHFTGICSLKPTPGRIPGRGHLPPCVGPFSILGAIGPDGAHHGRR